MGPAVVLGQDLTEAAGPVDTVRWQIAHRVTSSWVTVTAMRREDDSLERAWAVLDGTVGCRRPGRLGLRPRARPLDGVVPVGRRG